MFARARTSLEASMRDKDDILRGEHQLWGFKERKQNELIKD